MSFGYRIKDREKLMSLMGEGDKVGLGKDGVRLGSPEWILRPSTSRPAHVDVHVCDVRELPRR